MSLMSRRPSAAEAIAFATVGVLGAGAANAPDAGAFATGVNPANITHSNDGSGAVLRIPLIFEASGDPELDTIHGVAFSVDGQPVVNGTMRSIIEDVVNDSSNPDIKAESDSSIALPLAGPWSGIVAISKAISCQPGRTTLSVHGEIRWLAVYGEDEIVFDQEVPCAAPVEPVPAPVPVPPLPQPEPTPAPDCSTKTAVLDYSQKIAGEKAGKVVVDRRGRLMKLSLKNLGNLTITGEGNGISANKAEQKKSARLTIKLPSGVRPILSLSETRKTSAGSIYNQATGVLTVDIPQIVSGGEFSKSIKLVPKNPGTKAKATLNTRSGFSARTASVTASDGNCSLAEVQIKK